MPSGGRGWLQLRLRRAAASASQSGSVHHIGIARRMPSSRLWATLAAMSFLEIAGLLAFIAVIVWFGLRFPDRTPSTTPSPDELRDELYIPPDPYEMHERSEQPPT